MTAVMTSSTHPQRLLNLGLIVIVCRAEFLTTIYRAQELPPYPNVSQDISVFNIAEAAQKRAKPTSKHHFPCFQIT
jgi:hypothetical protein